MAQPATVPAVTAPRRSPLRRLGSGLLIALALLGVAAGATAWWVDRRVDASLPRLDGEVALAGLGAAVEVARDAAGVPTVRAASRADAARATGFLHAQDRFFQMDALRRRSAGELAEIFGPEAVAGDRALRVHRFRARAEAAVAAAEPEVRELLQAYAEGVDAGLAALGDVPFEYLLLRVEPQPWRPADSVLVAFSMFYLLQSDNIPAEEGLGLMREELPAELFAFLTPSGTSWDAPIDGSPPPEPAPIPGPEIVDLRVATPAAPAPAEGAPATPAPAAPAEPVPAPGSNNWAVAGAWTRDGGALLANDMHLPLGLPNVWYRLSLVWPDGAGGDRRVTGVSLPGIPFVVVGSNGRIAWGFTNAQADATDLVLLEPVPGDPEAYRTPDGPRRPEIHRERIEVKGAEAVELEVAETIWGPIFPGDPRQRRRALAWVAHEPGGVGFATSGLETAVTVDEAIAIAAVAGVPAQNLVAADADGRIAWAIAGRLPDRFGHDGRVPASWADGSRGWRGLLPAEAMPRRLDPEGGRIWTANNRVVGGEDAAKIGDGNQVPGTRAAAIRDRLLALERAAPADLLAIQLDDRARLYDRWRDVFLAALTPEAVASDPRRGEFRRQVEAWQGHASVDSVGYRLLRSTRAFLARELFGALTARCTAVDPGFAYEAAFLRYEGPLGRLVEERPEHFLPPAWKSWDELLLHAVDQTLGSLASQGIPVDQATWGRRNVVALRHPFSQAVPVLARYLDLPPAQLPGDDGLPRVQQPAYGASERLVVSPGREAEGIFHMPGGQSGHPRSPFYGAGHAAWEKGEPTPFLPGPAAHTLRLVPAATAS